MKLKSIIYLALLFSVLHAKSVIKDNKTPDMEIIEVEKNLYQYLFRNEEFKYTCNITVLVNDNKAVLIDASYADHMELLLEDLKSKNIILQYVILSHKHEDHIHGLKKISDVEVLAHENFITDHQKHLEENPDLLKFKPDRLLKDGDRLNFGEFELLFRYTEGHSACGITTVINDSIIHVGDMVFFTLDGKLSTPYVDDNSTVKGFKNGIKKIKKLNAEILLPGHGHFVKDKREIAKILDVYLYYSDKLISTKGNASLMDCLLPGYPEFSYKSFHANNKNKID